MACAGDLGVSPHFNILDHHITSVVACITAYPRTSGGCEVSAATRTFVKGLDQKQRFDTNKNGLEIKAVCVGTEKESSIAADNVPTPVAAQLFLGNERCKAKRTAVTRLLSESPSIF